MESREYTFRYDKKFQLESGRELPGFQLKYNTLGKLKTDRSNVIWVCHALTGSALFVDWWGDLFTDGAVFNPDDYFVICANSLGSCYGSTGPLSVDQASGKKYYQDFPLITNNDVIRAFDLLRNHLNLESINTLIGGSLGGQQVLSWAIYQPKIFENIIPIACNAVASPWSIAINEAQRMAIEADSTWHNRTANAGEAGLKSARAISMITFRSYEAYQQQRDGNSHILDAYKASAYQRHHGEKLASRFDAYSYWTLTKMMDNHNVGRYYSNAEQALSKITANALVIGIDSDLLFPISEQEFVAQSLSNARLEIIHSQFGHDAFLIETQQLNDILKEFLEKRKNIFYNEQEA